MQAFSLSFSIVFSAWKPIKYIGSKRSNLIAENLFFYDISAKNKTRFSKIRFERFEKHDIISKILYWHRFAFGWREGIFLGESCVYFAGISIISA